MARPPIPDPEEPVRRLVDMGLTLSEARTYVALLYLAPATAAEVAEAAGVPRPKVYGTLKLLEQRSFCYPSGDRVVKYRPVDPELALAEWARGREHERRLSAERDRRLLSELVGMLPHPSEHVVDGSGDVLMELTGGPAATIEDYERLIDQAERRIDIGHSTPVLQERARWNHRELAALARGVQVRVLFSTGELAIEHGFTDLIAAGGEVRVAKGPPLKVVVRDDGAEALIALPDAVDADRPICLLMRHADLIAPLQLRFNREWRRARRFAA